MTTTASVPPHTAPNSAPHTIRPAEPRDVPAIVGLIRELAEFEQLSHLVETTPERLHPQLFGERPVAECLVADDPAQPGTVIAFALFFTNFSTFKCKPGLYLEDLYVQPAHRGRGLGQVFLRRLATLAVERDYGRFEWCVLDWNAHAIALYQKMGATVMPDWRICRVAGDALATMAAPAA